MFGNRMKWSNMEQPSDTISALILCVQLELDDENDQWKSWSRHGKFPKCPIPVRLVVHLPEPKGIETAMPCNSVLCHAEVAVDILWINDY